MFMMSLQLYAIKLVKALHSEMIQKLFDFLNQDKYVLAASPHSGPYLIINSV